MPRLAIPGNNHLPTRTPVIAANSSSLSTRMFTLSATFDISFYHTTTADVTVVVIANAFILWHWIVEEKVKCLAFLCEGYRSVSRCHNREFQNASGGQLPAPIFPSKSLLSNMILDPLLLLLPLLPLELFPSSLKHCNMRCRGCATDEDCCNYGQMMTAGQRTCAGEPKCPPSNWEK